MTVLLVLLAFVTFLLIDHFHSRKVVVQPAVQVAKREAPPRLAPSLVGGFQVPEKLRYHPGHTWALSESPSLVRVGMDEFASKPTSKIERLTLPQRGQWIPGKATCKNDLCRRFKRAPLSCAKRGLAARQPDRPVGLSNWISKEDPCDAHHKWKCEGSRPVSGNK